VRHENYLPHWNRESFGYSLSAIADATARRSVAYLGRQKQILHAYWRGVDESSDTIIITEDFNKADVVVE